MGDFDLTAEELELFLVEADEQVSVMEDVLIALEREPDRDDLIQEIFRAAHTIKGGAATVGFEAMAALAHSVESLLDSVRQGTLRMTPELGDGFLESIDMFRRCLEAVHLEDEDNPIHFEGIDVRPLIERIDRLRGSDGSDGASTGGPVDFGGDQPRDPVDLAAADGGAPEDGLETGHGVAGIALDDLSDEGRTQIQQYALQTGDIVYRVSMGIAPGTAMPSVRAYQVILILEDHGTVVYSDPSRDKIERESIRLDRLDVLFIPTFDVSEAQGELDGQSFLTDIRWQEVAHAEGASGPAASSADEIDDPVDEATTEATPVASEPSPSRRAHDHGLGQTIRINVDLLDTLMNLAGELVIDRTRLVEIGSADMPADALREQLAEVSDRLSRVTTDLQETIMQVRMMPIDILFKKFPRMVRDLSRQLDKDITLELVGGDTELDRSVIEQIGDPLMHLLRNAIDHGIESAEERTQAGKAPGGRLTLSAEHKESHIFVTVQDDGRGLDRAVIGQRLLERGLVTAEQLEDLTDQEVYEMILLPGFSTAGEVSAVSGRGVGMDVVKQNIENVKGSVEIASTPGEGTRIIIKLPLTLAIIQALLVEVAGEVFAIPLGSVTEVVHLDPETVRWARGREMFPVREEMLPLVDPGHVWGPKWSVDWEGDRARPVVIIRAGTAPLGLKVDNLRGEQEVVIKTIHSLVGETPGISGASILGDGTVALIVDPSGLTGAMRQSRSERGVSA